MIRENSCPFVALPYHPKRATMPSKNKHVITVRMDRALFERVHQAAEFCNVSMNQFCCHAIRLEVSEVFNSPSFSSTKATEPTEDSERSSQ